MFVVERLIIFRYYVSHLNDMKCFYVIFAVSQIKLSRFRNRRGELLSHKLNLMSELIQDCISFHAFLSTYGENSDLTNPNSAQSHIFCSTLSN